MIYLTQKKLSSIDGTIKGDCFRTCIACLLDIKDQDDLPSFEDMTNGEWIIPFVKTLNSYGYQFNGCNKFEDIIVDKSFKGVDGYYIVGGKSPREWVKAGHATIYKDGKLVWDPHPSRDGILKEEEVYLIEKDE